LELKPLQVAFFARFFRRFALASSFSTADFGTQSAYATTPEGSN
jgi:hypothetical protein